MDTLKSHGKCLNAEFGVRSGEITRFNPLTAGAAYMRVFIFY